MNAFIGRLMWLGLFFLVLVASEYGVADLQSTRSDPNVVFDETELAEPAEEPLEPRLVVS